MDGLGDHQPSMDCKLKGQHLLSWRFRDGILATLNKQSELIRPLSHHVPITPNFLSGSSHIDDPWDYVDK